MDERWNEKKNRRVVKDAQSDNLYEMVKKIIEERIAAESRPSMLTDHQFRAQL